MGVSGRARVSSQPQKHHNSPQDTMIHLDFTILATWQRQIQVFALKNENGSSRISFFWSTTAYEHIATYPIRDRRRATRLRSHTCVPNALKCTQPIPPNGLWWPCGRTVSTQLMGEVGMNIRCTIQRTAHSALTICIVPLCHVL